jgi:hypothetical protein
MTISLDPGAFAMRSLRRRRDELVSRRCRSIAASIRESDARRRWLDFTNVPYLRAEDYLILPGSAATEADELFETIPRDLLPAGTIPIADPVTRQVISTLVEGLLPWSEHPGEICCYTQPGEPLGECPDLWCGRPGCPPPAGRPHHNSPMIGHEPPAGTDGDSPVERRMKFFARLIHLRGYRPVPLNPATALVLAELSEAGFSGVGVALGAASCEIAVVHRGNQIARGRLARGGRWIDEQLALRTRMYRRDSQGEQVLDVEGARLRKESTSLNATADDDSRLVANLYRNLVAELVEVVSETLISDSRIALLPGPLPIICGGGPARIDGFGELLRAEIDRQPLPVTVAGPRLVNDHEYAVARGCLIRAELEECASRDVSGAPNSRTRAGRGVSQRHSAAPRG